ncbi:MAG: secretion activating protein [Microcoleus vaginatus WJT46-NPBG5]|nr:secretion activating protein [Microcoleus vaginatus WJT46-NPBG5]
MTQPIDAFKTALQFTLKWEGGYSPNDVNGAVNRGITQATYDTYRQSKSLAIQTVSKITEAEVEEAYLELFWKPGKADLMCLPLAIVHFDTSVNFGVTGSTKFLQEALGGVPVDGDFGPKTMTALQQANNLKTAKRYCQCRLDYRQQRVKSTPSHKIFLEGWLNRDKDLLRLISQLNNETSAGGDVAVAETNTATVNQTNPHALEEQGSQEEALSPQLSVNSEKKDKIVEKLAQVINLLEEVVVTLKQSQ